MEVKDKRKILIYVTDIQLALLLKEILISKDFETDLFQDTIDGYNAFLTNQYDVCILELSNKERTGFNLGTDIRLLNPGIPIIFIRFGLLRGVSLIDFKVSADTYIAKSLSNYGF